MTKKQQLEKSLNFRYKKIIDDMDFNSVDCYTLELAEQYNKLVINNPKYHNRILFNLDSLKTYFKPIQKNIILQFNN